MDQENAAYSLRFVGAVDEQGPGAAANTRLSVYMKANTLRKVSASK